MKGRSWLIVSGVVFLLGGQLEVTQFLIRAESPLDRPNVMLARVRVAEISVGILVHSVVGALLAASVLPSIAILKITEIETAMKELGTRSTNSAASPSEGRERLASPVQPRRSGVRTRRLAIIGLVLSCSGVVLGAFGCLAGIACGHIARGRYEKAGAYVENASRRRVNRRIYLARSQHRSHCRRHSVVPGAISETRGRRNEGRRNGGEKGSEKAPVKTGME